MKKLFILTIFTALFIQAEAIQQIRWGSTGDPLNGLTVTWRNTGTSDSIRWGYTSSMTNGTFAGVKRNGYADYFFDYTFPSVAPTSTIYYELYDSNTHSWGSQLTYITAPAVNTTQFSFLALGDSRTNMVPWSQVAALSDSKHANFSVFLGDIVDDGSVDSEWDDWFNNGVQYLQNNLLYHCIGNHDASDTAKFVNIFTLPMANNSKQHFSFSYGNAIFICMNTENIDNVEYNWMVSTLQANQTKTWKVVFFHRPFFTIGPHAGEMNGELSTWWAAFDTYGVDVILNGHDHMYERSKPINWSVSPNAPVAKYGSGAGEGRCQIVAGGAGAPLYTGTPAWFTQTYQSKYHLCKIDVSGCQLTDSTFDNTNALIETFSLNKCPSGIENNNSSSSLTCRPNPTGGIFVLSYHAPFKGEATITITDMNGNKVAQEKVEKTHEDLERKFDLSGHARGIYLISVEINKRTDRCKLEIQ